MELPQYEPYEFIIVGNGPMPRTAIIEAMKDLKYLGETPAEYTMAAFAYLPLEGVEHPDALFFKTMRKECGEYGVQSAENYSFYCYQNDLVSLSPTILESAPVDYKWDDDILTSTEKITEANPEPVILVLLPEELSPPLAEFINKALSANRHVFVMNEGLWEVAKIDEQGIYEKLDDETPVAAAEAPVEVDTETGEVTTAPIYSFYSAADLEAMTRNDLKAIVKDMGVTPADWRAKQNLINAILDHYKMAPEIVAEGSSIREDEVSPPSESVEVSPSTSANSEVAVSSPSATLPEDEVFFNAMQSYHMDIARLHMKIAEAYQKRGATY